MASAAEIVRRYSQHTQSIQHHSSVVRVKLWTVFSSVLPVFFMSRLASESGMELDGCPRTTRSRVRAVLDRFHSSAAIVLVLWFRIVLDMCPLCNES